MLAPKSDETNTERLRKLRRLGGTDGSNPLSSSGESDANLTFGGEAHRWIGTEGRRNQSSPFGKAFRSGGTEGSNPAPSSGESAANSEIGSTQEIVTPLSTGRTLDV
jgi:hypothetical protein